MIHRHRYYAYVHDPLVITRRSCDRGPEVRASPPVALSGELWDALSVSTSRRGRHLRRVQSLDSLALAVLVLLVRDGLLPHGALGEL